MDDNQPSNAAMTQSEHPSAAGRLPVVAGVVVVAAIFLTDSLIRVPVPGVNEPHYLCKARADADSAWCQGDFFLQSANAHSVFFRLTGPLTRLTSFESVALTGRLVSCVLLAAGWTFVCRQLTPDFFTPVVSAGTYIIITHTGNFSGEWVVGGFESKGPAYAFALVGVACWLRTHRDHVGRGEHTADAQNGTGLASHSDRNWLGAGTAIGLAIALHPVVGVWFCLGVVMSELTLLIAGMWRCRRRQARAQTIGNLGVFLICATVCSLPGLIPALKLVALSDASEQDMMKANLIQVFWRLAHHLDPMDFPRFAWIHAATLAGITLMSVVVLWRRAQLAPPARALLTLLLSAMLIAAVGTAIGWHSGRPADMAFARLRTTLLKFYPFRFFDGLLPMTCALTGSLVMRTLARNRPRIMTGLAFVIITGSFISASCRVQSPPGGYTPAGFSTWKTACEWIRQNTPEDAVIFGPREGFGLKWYAHRAEYVCFKDCPQDASGILEWNRRLWVIHDWSRAAWQDRRFDDEDLARLRELTGVTHILTRRLGPFESPPVYQNDVWRVYATPDPSGD